MPVLPAVSFGGFASFLLHGFRQFFGAAEKTHANVVSLDKRQFLANIFAKKLHQEFDFSFGAAPIFHGKRVKGERFDFESRAGFDGDAGGLCAGTVPAMRGR